MAELQCPECGARIPNPEGWAKAAVTTLVAAPAVASMATQLRCPRCSTVFSQSSGGQPGEWRGLLPAVVVLAVLLAVAILIPAG
jgi:ribosomal protein S27E